MRDTSTRFPVAAPTGTSTTTRLHVTPDEDDVLTRMVDHLARLRRTDLAARAHYPLPARYEKDTPEWEAQRRAQRERESTRKKNLTAQSTSRWANSIIRGNDAQCALSRRGQVADMKSKRAAITAISRRLAVPCGQTEGKGRARVNGYKDQEERAQKQRRLQALTSRLARVERDWEAGVVHVVDGGKTLARNRHNLDAAGLTLAQWRRKWDQERAWVKATGSPDEPFGNLTITLTPAGVLSVRLPKPLEHLANSPRGRLTLTAPAVFKHQGPEWIEHVLSDRPTTAYTLHRKPGKPGWYLTAAWTITPTEVPEDHTRVLGVDLNADHLAGWVVDSSGNPIGDPITIPLALEGSASKRDATVRHAVERLLHVASRRGVRTVVVEDLGFEDARDAGRETMGRGERGKRFRATVAGIPTTMFRSRLQAACRRAGMALVAVAAAYTSRWGGEHWLGPLRRERPGKDVSRHHSAAVVIARRGIGCGPRRRTGVTASDRRIAVRGATVQAGVRAVSPGVSAAVGGVPGLSPARSRSRKRSSSRATVAPVVGHSDRQNL